MKNIIWNSVNELPEIPRGEKIECWVAVSFEKLDFSKPFSNVEKHYEEAKNTVLELHWLNASLTTEEADFCDEEGVLPDSSPGRLCDWTNEDGEHVNYTGWVEWLGGEESYYHLAAPDDEGYISGGNWAGRFKILAWTPIERPEFPAEFSPTK